MNITIKLSLGFLVFAMERIVAKQQAAFTYSTSETTAMEEKTFSWLSFDNVDFTITEMT